ncbi:MAG: hypothetical protein ACTSRG_25995, partial [Candidatus Helarchaeota archaeon]
FNESLIKLNKFSSQILVNWLLKSYSEILKNYKYLCQFKNSLLYNHFDYVETQIRLFKDKEEAFEINISNLKKDSMIIKIKSITEDFLQLLRMSYEIWGMLSILLDQIAKIKNFQVYNYQKKEELLKLEREAEMLKTINEKMDLFYNLKIEIQNEVDNKFEIIKLKGKELLQDVDYKSKQLEQSLKNRYLEFRNSISDRFSEISNEIDNKFQKIITYSDEKLKKMNNDIEKRILKNSELFKELEKKIQRNYTNLVSQLTEFFLIKFDLASIKKIDSQNYENFKRIADFYFGELYKVADEKTKFQLMQKLCNMHEKIVN